MQETPNPSAQELKLRFKKITPKAWAVGSLAGLSMLGLLLIIAGLLVANRDRGAARDPVACDMAQLEKGQSLPNIHAMIGPHLRVYGKSFFYAEAPISGTPAPSAEVEFTYVPLVSMEHPFAKKLLASAKQPANIGSIPKQSWPALEKFVVLLRTDRFNTVVEIPQTVEYAPSAHGLFFVNVGSLDEHESEVIRKALPNVDSSKVLILLEDTSPASPLMPWALGVAGLSLIGLGVLLVVRTKGPLRPPADGSEIVIQGPKVRMSERGLVRAMGVYGVVGWLLIYSFMDGWVMGGSIPVKWATLPVLVLGLFMVILPGLFVPILKRRLQHQD